SNRPIHRWVHRHNIGPCWRLALARALRLRSYFPRIVARVIQATANRSLARNIGLEHSSSEGAVFVDSDMLLSPDLLEECSQRLQEYQTLVIPEASFGGGFWAKCKSLERQTNLESEIEAARCFRKIAFLSL